jgi:hypothetical protein
MKNKNPLYVVKGQDVEEASGFWDLWIKKLNLKPTLAFFQELLKIVLEQIKTYPLLVVIKTMIDQWMQQLINMFQSFSNLPVEVQKES